MTPSAIRRFSTKISTVMAEADGSGEAKSRTDSLDGLDIRGVTKEFDTLPTTSITEGR